MYHAKKCGKQSKNRPNHRNRKRKFYGNRFSNENETEFASTSAKKFAGSDDFDAIVIPSHVFSIINFTLVFSALSNILKCKTCNGDVTFGKKDEQGLGFQLAVKCECGDSFIYSCEKIANKSYEINRRLVFVMRLLGIGINGINTFLGLMDLGKNMSISMYYSAVDNIFVSASAVFNEVIKKAGREEKEKNAADGNENKLIVSGDGTWSKRGFSSLFGVVTVIGYYTSKVLDVLVKSSFCKSCTLNKQKLNKTEYETWYSEHVQDCLINHKGSAGGMEVQGMLEIFARVEDLHGAKYKKYIGDGDTKTFKALLQQDGEVEKKECVNHVQKFTQNNNESFSKTVWQFAPKYVFCGSNIIEIATFLATCIFNEGFKPILKIMENMGITIGPYADLFASNRNAERIKDAERRTSYQSVEQRMALTNEKLNTLRNFEEAEGLLYGPGIAD